MVVHPPLSLLLSPSISFRLEDVDKRRFLDDVALSAGIHVDEIELFHLHFGVDIRINSGNDGEYGGHGRGVAEAGRMLEPTYRDVCRRSMQRDMLLDEQTRIACFTIRSKRSTPPNSTIFVWYWIVSME